MEPFHADESPIEALDLAGLGGNGRCSAPCSMLLCAVWAILCVTALKPLLLLLLLLLLFIFLISLLSLHLCMSLSHPFQFSFLSDLPLLTILLMGDACER